MRRSEPLAAPAHGCPVLLDLTRAETLALDLRRTMRRLRRTLRQCPACPGQPGCLVLERFNFRLETALAAVIAEWERGDESAA